MKSIIAAIILAATSQAHAGGYAGGSIAAVAVDQDNVDTGVAAFVHGGLASEHVGIGARIQSTYNQSDFFNEIRTWGVFLEPRISSSTAKRAYVYAAGTLGYMWLEDDFNDNSSMAYGGEVGVMINTGALDGNNFEIGPFARFLRIEEALGVEDVDAVFVGVRLGWNGY